MDSSNFSFLDKISQQNQSQGQNTSFFSQLNLLTTGQQQPQVQSLAKPKNFTLEDATPEQQAEYYKLIGQQPPGNPIEQPQEEEKKEDILVQEDDAEEINKFEVFEEAFLALEKDSEIFKFDPEKDLEANAGPHAVMINHHFTIPNVQNRNPFFFGIDDERDIFITGYHEMLVRISKDQDEPLNLDGYFTEFSEMLTDYDASDLAHLATVLFRLQTKLNIQSLWKTPLFDSFRFAIKDAPHPARLLVDDDLSLDNTAGIYIQTYDDDYVDNHMLETTEGTTVNLQKFNIQSQLDHCVPQNAVDFKFLNEFLVNLCQKKDYETFRQFGYVLIFKGSKREHFLNILFSQGISLLGINRLAESQTEYAQTLLKPPEVKQLSWKTTDPDKIFEQLF